MKNVYIVNECLSSAKNGIGTYLNELLYCLKAIGAEACLLTFNADCKEFNVTYSNKRTEMNFPVSPTATSGNTLPLSIGSCSCTLLIPKTMFSSLIIPFRIN